MDVKQIREILESPYNRKIWKSFIQTEFTNNNLLANDAPLNLGKSDLYTECHSLGYYAVDDYTKIGIFEIQLADKVNLSRNRVALRNLIKDITKQVAGAMVVFVQADKGLWRFSYISKRKVRNKENNTIEDKETAPKRYTYLFGKGEKALTAAQRFYKLIENQKTNLFDLLSLDDFEEAFSVEKLSKEFFANYKNAYEDFVQFLTGKRYAKKGSKYAEQVVSEPNWQLTALFGKDEKQARDFVKRMMGRIVFLYFIQKKGWLSVKHGQKWGEGNPDYLFELFKKSKQKDDFYAQELVPLFFTRLNNEDSENPSRDERFPYLNGGLFDDTQDRKYNKLHLPEEVFEQMFNTFNIYNFTIYEDAPDEHTVAVDPEMLGHIFENLLEDNKEKGAFYTPKEIVHYMCKESLKDYLIANEELNILDNDFAKYTIYKIIQQQELSKEEIQFAEKNAYKIIDALEQVKICDPAIGSGAFPMGLLQEIFNAQIYLQELKGFKKAKTDADIKKHIIEESIYGVDIDAGAVDIARLRFWLSLVVDEQEPQPLPNLDFKIICANTLIPVGYDKFVELAERTQTPTLLRMDGEIQKLQSIRDDYFKVKKKDIKDELQVGFENTKSYILSEFKSLRSTWKLGNFIDNIEKWHPFDFETAPCPWFDPWWMFGVKDGFDIVIGNPPYVQLQKDGGNLAKLYQPYQYDTFERTGDIYSLFYERGVQLLSDKGILCYITSNKWMRANYGASTRQFFAEKTYPLLLIDFGSVQVFETATVDTNILFLQNKPKAVKHQTKHTFAVRFTKDFDLANQSINDFINENGYHLTALNQNSWVVGERDIYNIKEYVEEQGVELKKWNVSFFLGLKTGFNEAFIIDNETRNKLIVEDKNNEKIIKPLLRGKDISAWYPEIESKWLINTHNGVKAKGIERINVEKDFPSIYKWLLQFEEQLLKRQDKGDEWTNLRNCAYLDEFLKPKIMYRDITQDFDFSYLNDEVYSNNTTYLITGVNLKYLTCFLNSKLFNYCFRDNFTDLGSTGRRLMTIFFEKIPVKKITDEQEIPFAKIVDYLVELKKQNSQEPTDQFMFIYFEQIANALVYELYFKEAFAKEGLEVASFVAQLPEIAKQSKEPVILQIRKAYIKAHEQDSPIRNAVEGMTSIPQINLINNSVTI